MVVARFCYISPYSGHVSANSPVHLLILWFYLDLTLTTCGHRIRPKFSLVFVEAKNVIMVCCCKSHKQGASLKPLLLAWGDENIIAWHAGPSRMDEQPADEEDDDDEPPARKRRMPRLV